MFEKLQDLKINLQVWYDDFMWKNGEERRQFAHNRLAAHELAMKEGRNSPYTHPDEYDDFF